MLHPQKQSLFLNSISGKKLDWVKNSSTLKKIQWWAYTASPHWTALQHRQPLPPRKLPPTADLPGGGGMFSLKSIGTSPTWLAGR